MIAAKLTYRVLRWPLMAVSWVAWGFVIGLVCAVTLPVVLGFKPMTVLTGSMRPMIQPGDMVVDQPILATQIRVGDIVTYNDPDGSRTITHRVRSVSISGGQAHVVTKGDANTTVEKWQIPVDGKVGRVLYLVPKIGYPVTWSHTPGGRIALVSIPALLLAIWALLKIWRSGDDKEPEGEELARGLE